MKPIYTVDFETDPFEFRVNIKPFSVGIYNGQDFASYWGPKCVDKLIKDLERREPGIIYLHNGGRFDIFFFIKHLDAEMRIINGRIVQCWLGNHEVRDSYAILPIGLGQYKKDDIDMNKLRRECRELHKTEILSYLRGDCVYLYELVSGFREEFGDFLTIGSAAMNQLRKFHPFPTGTKSLDEKFRKTFFYGGRVQCFRSGVIDMPYSIYDVNSMYPFVMKNYKHPIGNAYNVDDRIRRNTHFVLAEGKQTGPYGAFPMRNKKGGIDFNVERGQFACSIHEWNAALDAGWFKPSRILRTYSFENEIVFDEFVSHFYALRCKAQDAMDAAKARADWEAYRYHRTYYIFYKLILNSAYGKFAQNPDNFADWAITHRERMSEPWREHYIHNMGDYVIWKKPVQRYSYYNVAVGASITGAARSVLLTALRQSRDPLYVDTDSIVCRDLPGVTLHDRELGAWKLEGSGTRMAIAGKKLYACFDGDTCIKKATKGARISEDEIIKVARGGTAIYRKAAPTFKLDGSVTWIERKVKMTATPSTLRAA